MRFLAVAVLAVLQLTVLVRSEVIGNIKLGDDTVYVWKSFSDGSVTFNGGTIEMQGNSRIVLLKNNVQGQLGRDDYYEFKLSDKHFSYNIDLSGVPCECNAAAYFNMMPASNPGDGGEYYCDANGVAGNWCPEYDTLESNKYVIASTLHTCNGGPGNWNGCDGGGCQTKTTQAIPGQFGPGAGSIDTNQPFLISHYQKPDQVNIWMQQNGKTASFDVCYDNMGYKQQFGAYYDQGFVWLMSLWGNQYDPNGMKWLDGDTGCQSNGCDLPNARVKLWGLAFY